MGFPEVTFAGKDDLSDRGLIFDEIPECVFHA
jgi:hypothetical protein